MAASLYKFQVSLRLCDKHDTKELHAYCLDCKENICSSCIKEGHYSHDWDTITDILRVKKCSLPKECKDIREKQLPGLREEIDCFDRKIQRVDVTMEHDKSVLNSLRQIYIDRLNKIFDDRIDGCQKMHDETIQGYKETRDALKQKVEYLEMMTASLVKDINTLPDYDILDMEKEMRDELETALSYHADKYTCTTVFLPGQMDVQALENMKGEIHSVSVDEMNDINIRSGIISSLSPVSEASTWFVTNHDNLAKLIDKTGQEQKTKSTPCNDISTLSCGDLVLAEQRKAFVLVMTDDLNMIRGIDNKPLHPIFISKTENDDLLVSLWNDGDLNRMTSTSRRIIQRMTVTGQVLHTYEFNEDGETRLFTFPTRTAENKNTDICIVNVLSKDKGELIVLHKDWRVKFTYMGDGIERENVFLGDVECDNKCRILFTERYSRAIHMLSSEGMYLCTLRQYEHLHPGLISIYGDYLWCGFRESKIKLFKYI